MKKTILLFAASFVLVAFLNAQNDCTNSNTIKVKKKSITANTQDMVDHDYVIDCANPDGKDYFYQPDKFNALINNKSAVMHNQSYEPGMVLGVDPVDIFSTRGSKLCCVHPNPYDQDRRSRRNPKRIQ